jgi:hypothetical protein
MAHTPSRVGKLKALGEALYILGEAHILEHTEGVAVVAIPGVIEVSATRGESKGAWMNRVSHRPEGMDGLAKARGSRPPQAPPPEGGVKGP